MKKVINPARGMRDFLPEEKQKREYLLQVIRNIYSAYGFNEIETPALEEIERLRGSGGGENLAMIFEILKRGLDRENKIDYHQAVDLGLRYDLTLPLSRYYATHFSELPSEFRSLQIGNVWRAERPQKGRYRQFTQCDIDIIGVADNRAEIELIAVTWLALTALNITNCTVRINDRRLLSEILLSFSYQKEQLPLLLIIIDKIDKIAVDGVKSELIKNFGEMKEHQQLCQFLTKWLALRNPQINEIFPLLPNKINSSALDSLVDIITKVKIAVPEIKINFDPTLVRGMGYYTGAIFEVSVDGETSSIAGGGRYDGMIGTFLGTQVAACGFSLGFERILALIEKQTIINKSKVIIFYNEETSIAQVFLWQKELVSQSYQVSSMLTPKKMAKALEKLHQQGFNYFINYDPLIQLENLQPDNLLRSINSRQEN